MVVGRTARISGRRIPHAARAWPCRDLGRGLRVAHAAGGRPRRGQSRVACPATRSSQARASIPARRRCRVDRCGRRQRAVGDGCATRHDRRRLAGTARDPDRAGHRLQRQDHHRAPARGDDARAWLAHRAQLYRWRVLRWAGAGVRRFLRADRRAHGAAAARRAGRDPGNRARRHPASWTGDVFGRTPRSSPTSPPIISASTACTISTTSPWSS